MTEDKRGLASADKETKQRVSEEGQKARSQGSSQSTNEGSQNGQNGNSGSKKQNNGTSGGSNSSSGSQGGQNNQRVSNS